MGKGDHMGGKGDHSMGKGDHMNVKGDHGLGKGDFGIGKGGEHSGGKGDHGGRKGGDHGGGKGDHGMGRAGDHSGKGADMSMGGKFGDGMKGDAFGMGKGVDLGRSGKGVDMTRREAKGVDLSMGKDAGGKGGDMGGKGAELPSPSASPAITDAHPSRRDKKKKLTNAPVAGSAQPGRSPGPSLAEPKPAGAPPPPPPVQAGKAPPAPAMGGAQPPGGPPGKARPDSLSIASQRFNDFLGQREQPNRERRESVTATKTLSALNFEPPRMIRPKDGPPKRPIRELGPPAKANAFSEAPKSLSGLAARDAMKNKPIPEMPPPRAPSKAAAAKAGDHSISNLSALNLEVPLAGTRALARQQAKPGGPPPLPIRAREPKAAGVPADMIDQPQQPTPQPQFFVPNVGNMSMGNHHSPAAAGNNFTPQIPFVMNQGQGSPAMPQAGNQMQHWNQQGPSQFPAQNTPFDLKFLLSFWRKGLECPRFMSNLKVAPDGQRGKPQQATPTQKTATPKAKQEKGKGKGKLPTQSENAYKTAKSLALSNDEKLKRDVRRLLNKVAPETLKKLAVELGQIAASMKGPEDMKTVISIIFEKALAEPHYCDTYSNLVMYVKEAQSFPTFPPEGVETKEFTLTRCLLNQTQRVYESERHYEPGEDILAQCNGDKTHDLYKTESARLRKRYLNLMRFIGALFLRQLLSIKIIQKVIMDLILPQDSADALPDSFCLECSLVLLMSLGYTLDQTALGQTFLNSTVCPRLKDLRSRDVYEPRLRFLIEESLDCRQKNWNKKEFKEQAKKLADVRKASGKFGEVVKAGAQPAELLSRMVRSPAPMTQAPGQLSNQLSEDLCRRIRSCFGYFCDEGSAHTLAEDWRSLQLRPTDLKAAMQFLIEEGYSGRVDKMDQYVAFFCDLVIQELVPRNIFQDAFHTELERDLDEIVVDTPAARLFYDKICQSRPLSMR